MMLTDREAARMRAETIVAEIGNRVHRALHSGRADGATLHNTLPPAAFEMLEEVCKIYADEIVGASEQPLFDELKTEIANRVNAFVSSTVAGIGNAGSARIAADVHARVSMGVHSTLALAAHAAAKARGGVPKPAAPLTPAATDAIAAFKLMPIHADIRAACEKQFADGHYREAILNAAIAVVNIVKKQAGTPVDSNGKELDGTPLMHHVFGGKTPRLKVNALASQTDLDEQEGMHFLFAGATQGLRNPRAHALDPDTPEYAVEAIALISLLAKEAQAAKP